MAKQINLKHAKCFIKDLYGDENAKVSLQLFKDKKEKGEPSFPKELYGTLDSFITDGVLQDYQRKGYGVHITMNRTDGNGRKKDNIIEALSFFIDVDGNSEIPKEWPLRPSIVTKRDNYRWHAHWLLNEPIKDLDHWRDLQLCISSFFKSDKSMANVNVCKRLPGFLHLKDLENPTQYLICLRDDPVKRYNISDIEKAFKFSKNAKEKPDYKSPKDNRDSKKKIDKPIDWESAIFKAMSIIKAHIKPAVEGNGGDITTYKAACVCKDYGLSEAAALEVLKEYNKQCCPPWSIEDLKSKIENAYRYGSKKKGCRTEKLGGVEFETLNIEAPDIERAVNWLDLLDMDKHGKIKTTLSNTVTMLSNAEALNGRISHNQFSDDTEVVKALPWTRQNTPKAWDDDDTLLTTLYLHRNYKFSISLSKVEEAVRLAALENAYHPVLDYLKGLTWEGEELLDTWLTRFCGVEDNDYTRAVASKTLIAAVRRVCQPGCKFDNVLVIEGDQGIGKSYLISILGGEWFADTIGDFNNKDAIEIMRGKWIIELAELAFAAGADNNALKAFLSRQSDRARLAYAKNAKDFQRQCIFIGTSNDSEYLKDPTGARRFWPIKASFVDIEGLKRFRDQLFAEAYQRHLRGESIYLDTKETQDIAYDSQSDRYILCPWEDIVKDYLDDNYDHIYIDKGVSIAEIFTGAIHSDVSRFDLRANYQIKDIITRLNYKSRTIKGRKRYFKPAKYEVL